MSVDITLGGNGSWKGGSGHLENYSVNEESTPLEASDTSGAVSQIAFDVDESDDTLLLYGTPIVLTDGEAGSLSGQITGVTTADFKAKITGESSLAALVPEQPIAPHYGTLKAAFEKLLAQVNITTPVVFDPALNAGTTIVAMQGWYGSPWDWIKMICVSHQIEIALMGESIEIRRPRLRTLTPATNTRIAEDASRGQMAVNIEVIRYVNEYKASALVYPAGGWSEDLEVYTVDADETIEIEVPVDVSIMSIEQPTCVSFVPLNYSGPSVYTVAGNDGLPIPPAMWRQNGGKIEVGIGLDSKSILLTITGPSLQHFAPFSIAMTSGETETYSSLRLRGEGVHFETETHSYPTGADSKIARQEVGVTIDNPTMQTGEQFSRMVRSAARAFSKPAHTISATAHSTEQSFGNLAGSLVRRGDAIHRVRRATIGPGGVSWEAEADTTYEQIRAVTAGKTYAELQAERAGMTYAEIALTPLRG